MTSSWVPGVPTWLVTALSRSPGANAKSVCTPRRSVLLTGDRTGAAVAEGDWVLIRSGDGGDATPIHPHRYRAWDTGSNHAAQAPTRVVVLKEVAVAGVERIRAGKMDPHQLRPTPFKPRPLPGGADRVDLVPERVKAHLRASTVWL